MLKGERVGCGKERKASKIATLVPEFVVEDLPLDKPATFVPALLNIEYDIIVHYEHKY